MDENAVTGAELTPEQQKEKTELLHLESMFKSEGWKLYIKNCVEDRRSLARIFEDKNSSIEDIRFAQGQIHQLNFTISMEALMSGGKGGSSIQSMNPWANVPSAQ